MLPRPPTLVRATPGLRPLPVQFRTQPGRATGKVHLACVRTYAEEATSAGKEARSSSDASRSSGFATAVKVALGLAFTGAGAYGGAVYYALENPEFREEFVGHVYGAEEAVARAQAWRDEGAYDKLKASAAEFGDKAVSISSEAYHTAASVATTASTKTLEIREKSKTLASDLRAKTHDLLEKSKLASETVSKKSQSIIDRSTEAASSAKALSHEFYDKARGLYDTLTGQPPTPPLDQPPLKGFPKAMSREVEEEAKAAKGAVKTEAATLAAKVQDTAKATKHTVENGFAVAQDSTKNVVVNAEEQVRKLGEKVESAAGATKHGTDAAAEKALQSAKLAEEKAEKLQQALNDAEKRMQEQRRKVEEHLRNDFALEKAELALVHSEELKRQLALQAANFETRLGQELAAQASMMERRWLREMQLHVDRERGGRLARLDQLETRLVALERLIDTNADALAESVRAHHLRAAVQSLRDVFSEPARRPFARELAAIQAVAGVDGRHPSGSDDLIRVAAVSIPTTTAAVGIDTLPDLVARFTVVADEVRRVALVPEDASGVVPHAISALLSGLMFRKHGLPEGDDVESILARTEFYLREEELDAATRELNQLKGWAKVIASDWLKAARAHLEVTQALELIELQLNALTLRIG